MVVNRYTLNIMHSIKWEYYLVNEYDTIIKYYNLYNIISYVDVYLKSYSETSADKKFIDIDLYFSLTIGAKYYAILQ